MFVAGHEVIQGFCLHCGAREDAITASLSVEDGAQLTCRASRKPDETRPEPSLRTYAVDDIDVIHQRIAELAKEREAAVAAPSEWHTWIGPTEEMLKAAAEIYTKRWIFPDVTSSTLFLDEDAAYLKW